MNKKRKPGWHISGAGAILLYALGLGAWWGVWEVWREVRQSNPQWQPDGKIVIEGIFADSPEDIIQIEQETTEPPSEVEVPDGEQTTEFEIKEASANGLPIGSTIPSGCVAVPKESKDVKNGNLLRIDSNCEFSGTAGELVTFEGKNASYRMKNMNLQVKSEVVDAMNQMAAAYETVTGKANLMVYSTTEPYNVEGSLYPTVLPDSKTGYCLDLCVLNEDETISKILEESPWLSDNAYLYGFVCSYTAEDEEVTGISSAPYHLRYVGKVHAAIMHEEGLTLTAYFESLKQHTISEPYQYSDGNTNWTVYYVPAVPGGTEVPVALDADYEVSGNNMDGFIVTASSKVAT